MSDILKTKIEIPIYNIGIDLYYGDMDNILPVVQSEFITQLMIDEYTAAYTTFAERKVGGLIHKKLVIVISSNRDDLFTIHHECIHAAMFALEHVGVNVTMSKHESLTYLVTFIAEEVDRKIKQWKSKRIIEQPKDI